MHTGWRRRAAAGLACALALAGAAAQQEAQQEAQQAAPAAKDSASAPGPSGPSPRGAAPRLPLEHFARLPLVQAPALSPDGRRFAALMNAGDDTLLVVRDLAGGPMKPLLKTDNKAWRFAWFRWVSDQRLVVSARYPSFRGWTEVAETRLFSVSAGGSGIVNLSRRGGSDNGYIAQFQDQVIDWLPGDGQHLLLQLADDRSLDPSVFRVNVETGRRTLVHPARSQVQRWITDRTHRVRVGVRQDGARVSVLVSDAASDQNGDPWRTAWTFDVFSPEAVEPLGFGADPHLLYIRALHQGRQAVFEVDLRDPALPRTLRLAHPRFDVPGELLHHPLSGAAVGVRPNEFGHSSATFWDPDMQQLVQAIDQALPQRLNHVLQFNADGQRYLLHSQGNGEPGSYFVGFRASGTLALLANTYPQLDPGQLARKQPLDITARDGRALPSLLTLPLGVAPTALPVVVLPHGGPLASDGSGFDPWVQFLASRGYAVLQVNFRGSAGFGHEHLAAGLKRWGLEMQDDLADAVQALVARGTADPKRVCIVGGSYGGYAALMGAAKTPGLYRCVVSYAGISDLVEMGDHQRRFLHGQAVYERQVGSLWDEREQLKATSPRRLADRIDAPVLLVHGTADRSVPFEQSELMAQALKSAGKAHRLVEQKDGDHHLSHQAHRLQFFRELEAFLDQHLGGAAAPSAAAGAK